MKKFSQRVAALTPSITAGLILFAVALTALLAYRAFDASRAHKQLTERTLRDYAGFAAFQVKSLAMPRILGRFRGAYVSIVESINTHGPTPPLGAERTAELIRARGEACRCLEGVSFYYEVTFADSSVQATASELATPENLRQIRDTVIAHVRMLAPERPDPPLSSPSDPRPPGVPATASSLVTIFSRLSGRQYVLSHALTADGTGKPIVAHGFVVPAEQVVGRAVTSVLATQPVLPRTLMRGVSADSIVAVTVRRSTDVIFASDARNDTHYAASDSVDERVGGLHFQVAINPAAAGRLIIGGLPRSRLPEVLATAFLAVSLLGLLLYQFRRQEELGRLRDDFVSGVSHELRTPLAQIRLLAELLRLGKVPAEERDRSLRIIDKEARRLTFLVDSILSFTHSQPGALSPIRTDVASEIAEIVAGFGPLAAAQGVLLTSRLEDGIVADVDRGALRQVLLNLLDNAVRYGPPSQNVTITTTSAGDTWILEVADQGPGIPAEESERIFAPYYRMQRDAGGAVGGTGIGLAVVRRLVNEHGGRVHVASSNGNGAAGARFVVTLPTKAREMNGR